jgi:arylsulfatase
VLNDAMRRDRVGAYGGPARTPHFDALAAEGILFERGTASAPWTKPSIATLFTSLFPSQHGITTHPGAQWRAHEALRAGLRETDALPEEHTTLAEAFRARGFRTAAFVSNPWLDRRFGFAQGVEVYDDSFGRFGVEGSVVSRAALDWLRALPPGQPYFLYLHYLDTHRPYGTLSWREVLERAEEFTGDDRPISAYTRGAIQELVHIEGAPPAAALMQPRLSLLEMAYDRGVEDFDVALGEFLAGLDAHWSREHTALWVTSDHGEALFERGYGNHGRGLFDDELGIPMLLRLPGTAPRRVACPVGLIDVMPTLCDAFGLSCPETMFGESLLRSNLGDRLLVSEGVRHRPRHRAVRNRRFKLVFEPEGGPQSEPGAGPYSLYDLREDPGERTDLLDQRDERTRRLLRDLAAELEGAVPPFSGPEPEKAAVDAELEHRLRALGYLD